MGAVRLPITLTSRDTVAPDALIDLIENETTLSAWLTGRTGRVGVGFYTSQALEMIRR